MLIIFDLDDTLIQTSRFITPCRFERVIEALDLSEAIKRAILEDLNKGHLQFATSKQAITHVLKSHGVPVHLIEHANFEMDAYDPQVPVVLFEGVVELANILKARNCHLVIVTAGSISQQTYKIQKSGITDHVSSWYIVESGSKQNTYQEVAKNFLPNEVLVIGDRVASDLLPAKALGFKTCLVRQGRGQFQEINSNIIDFVIQDVTEVENLIKSLQKTFST